MGDFMVTIAQMLNIGIPAEALLKRISATNWINEKMPMFRKAQTAARRQNTSSGASASTFISTIISEPSVYQSSTTFEASEPTTSTSHVQTSIVDGVYEGSSAESSSSVSEEPVLQKYQHKSQSQPK